MDKNNVCNLAQVILPVKYNSPVSYTIPSVYQVNIGSRVMVDFAGKLHEAIVEKIYEKNLLDLEETQKKIDYKPILNVEDLVAITPQEFKFWEQISNYYLCSKGEVFKAAYPANLKKQIEVKSKITPKEYIGKLSTIDSIIVPTLSNAQEDAYAQIAQYMCTDNKPILLEGVTGSGKTEVYIRLAKEQMEKGNSILYMVPEIALSKQLFNRLKKIFGERLLTFHSKQTIANKTLIYRLLSQKDKTPFLILGTRSSLFLPLKDLGLIIIDEEHDPSYKQTEPAPRYNARDAAIMLSQIHNCNVVLGSATPSFETIYNCATKKFHKVELTEKYFGGEDAIIDVIDTIKARKTKQMRGNFSQKLINEITKTINNNQQILIFKNRRSYAPIVECSECGAIPRCPHCNVYLSYHKFNNTLRCHYCDYVTNFIPYCSNCGLDSLTYKGVGTEKLEEELKALFPNKNIARYDSDTTKSKKAEEQIIKDFANGNINILVGTQMITKGFDFENLKLVAVIQGEAILGIQDFRADERSLQLLKQLMGRCGRRGERGKIIIQSNIGEHPVYNYLKYEHQNKTPHLNQILLERKEFDFPPFVRLIKIIIKHHNPSKINEICSQILETKFNCKEVTGPFTPQIDKVRGEYIKCFYAKFQRDNTLINNKREFAEQVSKLRNSRFIILDVDPI